MDGTIAKAPRWSRVEMLRVASEDGRVRAGCPPVSIASSMNADPRSCAMPRRRAFAPRACTALPGAYDADLERVAPRGCHAAATNYGTSSTANRARSLAKAPSSQPKTTRSAVPASLGDVTGTSLSTTTEAGPNDAPSRVLRTTMR